MSSGPFSERASMPEEAGKHLCSGPGHGIDEMRINRHPKSSHLSPKFARAANPSSPSQPDDAVLLYKLLQKVWELSPTSRIAFACLCCLLPRPPFSHLQPPLPPLLIGRNRGPAPLLRSRLWPTSFQLTLAYHVCFIFGSSAAMELKS